MCPCFCAYGQSDDHGVFGDVHCQHVQEEQAGRGNVCPFLSLSLSPLSFSLSLCPSPSLTLSLSLHSLTLCLSLSLSPSPSSPSLSLYIYIYIRYVSVFTRVCVCVCSWWVPYPPTIPWRQDESNANFEDMEQNVCADGVLPIHEVPPFLCRHCETKKEWAARAGRSKQPSFQISEHCFPTGLPCHQSSAQLAGASSEGAVSATAAMRSAG